MMTKLNLMKPILAAVCTALLSFSLSAQVVKNDRLLSFEQPELPAGLSATKGTLGISDQHYKDGPRVCRDVSGRLQPRSSSYHSDGRVCRHSLPYRYVTDFVITGQAIFIP